jgi:transcriptional regulator with XRE-family HTH domain
MMNKDELQARRQDLRLSQREMAARLGITQEHYNRIETGKFPISRNVERKFNQLLDEYSAASVSVYTPAKCPACQSRESQKVTDPDEDTYRIWRCTECGAIFTGADSAGVIKYSPIERADPISANFEDRLKSLEERFASLERHNVEPTETS